MADQPDGFIFDVKTWRGSRAVHRMAWAQRGIYFEMLCEEWEKGSLPDDPQSVADAIASTPEQAAEVIACWPAVRGKFLNDPREPGRIYNAKLEATRQKQRQAFKAKQQAGRVAGKASAAKRRQTHELPVNDRSTVVQRSSTSAERSSTVLSSVVKSSLDQSLSPARVNGTTDDALAERAGNLLRRFDALYSEHRHGAKYRAKPAIDFPRAVELCQTWPEDAHLDKLAVIVLTTDDDWISRTDRGFGIFAARASWADDRLRQVQARRA